MPRCKSYDEAGKFFSQTNVQNPLNYTTREKRTGMVSWVDAMSMTQQFKLVSYEYYDDLIYMYIHFQK